MPPPRRQAEAVAHALFVVLAVWAVPGWVLQVVPVPYWPTHALGRPLPYDEVWSVRHDAVFLLLGALLVAPDPRRYGVCLGSFWPNRYRVLLVTGGPLLVTFAAAPFVALPPFPASIWLVSPLAQQLVFNGYLLARMDEAFPGTAVRRIDMRWGVPITAGLFSLWHIPNFLGWPAGFVAFQLLYTFAGGLLIGLSRQWTGSILYGIAAHVIANGYCWWLSPAPVRWGIDLA
jgi:membrane protease YdiL (CAAX protease family)